MGVNHRSLDVLVTEKFLNCPDVVARFQELRGEGMTECVAGGPFGQVGPFHRAVDRLLDDRFVNVMASLLARLWAFSGSPAERSIAAPLLGSVGVFTVEGVWQENATPTVGQVALVDCFDGFEVLLQRGFERLGQHSDTVFRPLAVADEDFVSGEIDVLDAQTQTFHQSQSRAVHQRGHEPLIAGQVRQHGFHFLAGHDHRQAFGFPGADDFAQVAHFTTEDVTIKEKQRGKRLVLSGGACLFLRGQMRQEGVDFWFGHFGGVADVVKVDVASNPMAIGLLRTRTVMARPQGFAQLVKQLGSAGATNLPIPKGWKGFIPSHWRIHEACVNT